MRAKVTFGRQGHAPTGAVGEVPRNFPNAIFHKGFHRNSSFLIIGKDSVNINVASRTSGRDVDSGMIPRYHPGF